MKISSTSLGINATIFNRIAAKNQNSQFNKLINNINNKFQQRNQNYDMVELSMKAKEAMKSKDEKPEKVINYENSPIEGKRTQADWAESSLTQQRNGVSSVRNVLEYQKERLETFVSKISEYEKIAGGEVFENDTLISKERATELIAKYKESIKSNFSNEINSTINFYNSWAKTYDGYSSGLASKVIGNVLESVTSETLGLDNLSDNPDEIIKALDSAIEKLNSLSKSIEDKFYQATGNEKKMLEFASLDTKENTSNWNKRKLEWEITNIEMATIDDNTKFTGKTLEI